MLFGIVVAIVVVVNVIMPKDNFKCKFREDYVKEYPFLRQGKTIFEAECMLCR